VEDDGDPATGFEDPIHLAEAASHQFTVFTQGFALGLVDDGFWPSVGEDA